MRPHAPGRDSALARQLRDLAEVQAALQVAGVEREAACRAALEEVSREVRSRPVRRGGYVQGGGLHPAPKGV